MLEDPDSLLLQLNCLSDAGAVDLTRQVWNSEYMQRQSRKGRIGVWPAHDGIDVVFFEDVFEHAFYKSRNLNLYPDDKSVFDRSRAERIRWIKRVIACGFRQVECWLCPGYGKPGKLDRRLYIAWDLGYIVWLGMRSQSGLRFRTAYRCGRKKIRGYIRGGKKIK